MNKRRELREILNEKSIIIAGMNPHGYLNLFPIKKHSLEVQQKGMLIIFISHRLDEVLELSGRTTVIRVGVIRNISFDLGKGEILGFYDLAGAGRTEIMRAIIAADKRDSGEINVIGERKAIRSVEEAIASGIAPESL